MKSSFLSLFFLATACMALPAAAADAPEKPLTRAEVEEIVKKVIQENPEVLVGALDDYQMKKRAEMAAKFAKNVGKLQNDLKNDPLSPTAGNPHGDVTIVEFSDYHCGFCKRFLPVLSKVMETDRKIRVVFKEFPILSEDSTMAAKAALAVYNIDKKKYLQYHKALMDLTGKAFTEELVTEKAKEVGIDAVRFSKALQDPELDKELDRTRELAKLLDITATPSIVIGNGISPGAINMEDLKKRIAEEREEDKLTGKKS